jgi:hypothetical protein
MAKSSDVMTTEHARALLAAGYQPGAIAAMRHAGSEVDSGWSSPARPGTRHGAETRQRRRESESGALMSAPQKAAKATVLTNKVGPKQVARAKAVEAAAKAREARRERR